jgi:AsnC-like helix-turn-helix protein
MALHRRGNPGGFGGSRDHPRSMIGPGRCLRCVAGITVKPLLPHLPSWLRCLACVSSSLSRSACLRRVKALEASGIGEGYRAEVSRTKAGLGLTAFIGLRVEGHSRATSQQIEHTLTAIPAVVGCYVTSDSDDFMVEVAVQDLAD